MVFSFCLFCCWCYVYCCLVSFVWVVLLVVYCGYLVGGLLLCGLLVNSVVLILRLTLNLKYLWLAGVCFRVLIEFAMLVCCLLFVSLLGSVVCCR